MEVRTYQSRPPSYKAEQIPEILTMPVYSTSSLVYISMTESIYSTAFGSYSNPKKIIGLIRMRTDGT